MSDTTLNGVNIESGQVESRKETSKKVCGLWISGLDWLNILLSFKSCFFMQLSPLSTLESSFEALNVKKFDGDLKSYSVSVTCLMRRGVEVVLKIGYIIVFFLFQLHLSWILSIAKQQQNSMKVEPRVF